MGTPGTSASSQVGRPMGVMLRCLPLLAGCCWLVLSSNCCFDDLPVEPIFNLNKKGMIRKIKEIRCKIRSKIARQLYPCSLTHIKCINKLRLTKEGLSFTKYKYNIYKKFKIVLFSFFHLLNKQGQEHRSETSRTYDRRNN